MMQRRAATVAACAVAFATLSLARRADAQRVQERNPALMQQTIDAAALGHPANPFLEYVLGSDLGYHVLAGFSLGGGVLRATFSHAYQAEIVGLGYARTLGTKDLGFFGTAAAGVDLAAGYNSRFSPSRADRAVRLSIPLSLRWGSPSRLSFAPYIAPFAERGSRGYLVSDCVECFGPVRRTGLVSTSAMGVTAGFELTIWRVGVEFAQRDVLLHHNRLEMQSSLGLRWHF